jgi:pantothenate kinase
MGPDDEDSMRKVRNLAEAIRARAGSSDRIVVALAGPPASGKSTVAAALAAMFPEDQAAVVPMDGFHFDDAVLRARGLSHRKGAPETFDYGGFESLLRRIRSGEDNIAIPVFDRGMELSRAAAAIVGRQVRFVLVEGNYLLLDEEPWTGLARLFDFSVFIEVSQAELDRRLVERWREHGREPEAARHWIDGNDLPNILRVLERRRPADLVFAVHA